MKIQPQDQPKAIALVLGIVVCLALIGKTVMGVVGGDKSAENKPAPSPIVAGAPERTAALEPQADPMQYLKNVEAWSRPPMAPAGDPFRTVLPRSVSRSLASGMGSSSPRPASEITGNSFDGPGLPPANFRVEFPDIKVQGVLIDKSSGTPTSFAVLQINGQTTYAKAGDIIGNALKVDRVTELGVWIWAAKEHAFIEVDKAYRPNGMPPAAPNRR